jgi:hypothetical protein
LLLAIDRAMHADEARHDDIRGHRSVAPRRSDFIEHTAGSIRPWLRGSSACSELFIDRILEEHLAERAAFWESLFGSADVAEPLVLTTR